MHILWILGGYPQDMQESFYKSWTELGEGRCGY